MKRAVVWFPLSASLTLLSSGERADERVGCTAIAIDGAASLDGSAFAGMNTDSQSADYRLTFVPPKVTTEKWRPIYTFNLSYPRFVGFGRGSFYHPHPPDHPLYEPVGYIPEVDQTFGYYEATCPLMNDQGLAFGESSCAAMLVNRFPDDKADDRDVPIGLLDTMTLMQLALERCATARCGVDLMGQLSEQFGFVPTPGEPSKGIVVGRTAWDDAGEAYTLADGKGEAWVFHVLGGVTGITKSVWVAQKVPKGHFAVVANEFMIGELPEEPNEEFRFNKVIFQAAKVAGLWDGQGRLHFAKVFAPDPVMFESPAGSTPIPLYASVRRYALHNLVAPSKKLAFHLNSFNYGFSMEVEKKLSHRDVMGFFRYQYEGTEFDLRQGMLAGPFGYPFRLEGGPGKTGQVPRGIAIQRTLYGVIGQSGPARRLAWFAMDTPTTSVYVPLYCSSDSVAKEYSTGNQAEFSRETAQWAFNFVNNYMALNYNAMSHDDVYPAIEHWQDIIDEERKSMEVLLAEGSDKKLVKEQLNKWQRSVQERLVASWWNMSDFLIMKYNDGRVNFPRVGTVYGYPKWWADMIGFSNDIHPIFVQPTRSPFEATAHMPPGYIAPEWRLPVAWNSFTQNWSYAASEGIIGKRFDEMLTLRSTKVTMSTCLTMNLINSVVMLLGGVVIGQAYQRSKQRSSEQSNYRPLLCEQLS